jgi:hypothetical protein
VEFSPEFALEPKANHEVTLTGSTRYERRLLTDYYVLFTGADVGCDNTSSEVETNPVPVD